MMEPRVWLIAAARGPTSRQRARRLDGDEFHCGLYDLRDLLGIAKGVSPRCRFQLAAAADARILAEPAPHDSEMHALLALMVIQADGPVAGTHPARSELHTLGSAPSVDVLLLWG